MKRDTQTRTPDATLTQFNVITCVGVVSDTSYACDHKCRREQEYPPPKRSALELSILHHMSGYRYSDCREPEFLAVGWVLIVCLGECLTNVILNYLRVCN